MTTTSPLVSVVIPVRDDAERLARCLDALRAQSLEEAFEVIVVDNGSAEPPVSAVAALANAKLVHEPKPTSYAARNAGARAATGRILAFTDADCVPSPDWLVHGVGALAEAGRDVFVGGRVNVFASDPSRPTATELHELVHAFPQRSYVEQRSFSVTANLFVTRDAFDRAGPFAEDLVSSGDLEWGTRASRAGIRPVYSDAVVVSHPARRSLREMKGKLRRLHAGAAQLASVPGFEDPATQPPRGHLRPPVRSIARNAARLDSPTLRNRTLYAGAALYLHYVHALGSRRTTAGGARP